MKLDYMSATHFAFGGINLIKYLTLLLFIQFSNIYAQNVLVDAESRLFSLINNLRNTKEQSELTYWNNKLKSELIETFKLEGAMYYNFTRLKTIGIIKSSDNQVCIISWNIQKTDLSHDYFCLVVNNEITELIYNDNLIKERPTGTLNSNNWYGALYYSIITKERQGIKYYILIGWNANDLSTDIKLIDVLYFKSNKPKLGAEQFKNVSGTHKRLFFEYNQKSIMSVRFDDRSDQIIYDHLSPESPVLKGHKSYYVPDMSYDSYKYHNNYWYHIEDVEALNKQDLKKITIYTYGLNEPIKKMIKYKWVNPE